MSKILIKGCSIYIKNKIVKSDLLIDNEIITKIAPNICDNKIKTYTFDNNIIVPGLIDIHTHLREPGYCKKETIKTGSKAAAHGGFTTICSMPNLNPNTDSVLLIKKQLALIKKNACINVLPYSTITKGRKGLGPIVDTDRLSKYCFAFSNDGTGIDNSKTMLEAMKKIKKTKKVLVAHTEDITFNQKHGCIHEGKFAKKYKLPYISSASEHKQVERDIELAIKTKCQYHVCHVSTKETVALIKKGQTKSKLISCEVTPHHLLLDESSLKDCGCYKMSPPLRSKQDRLALINGIKNNTIQIIATDHAPHMENEKNKGLSKSAFGIVGLDFAFPLLYTNLVLKKIISLNKLINLMSTNPSKIFNLPSNEIKLNTKPNLMIFDPNKIDIINNKNIFSKGKSTPFTNKKCKGWVNMTICNGKIVYENK